MEITKTLRVKKVFFDRILSGEKRVEYRDYKEYYKKIFSYRPTYIVFHYQTGPKIKVKVKSISVVRTPKILKNSKINFSDKVFKIELGKVYSL